MKARAGASLEPVESIYSHWFSAAKGSIEAVDDSLLLLEYSHAAASRYITAK